MGKMVTFVLDPANPPRISPETEARLDAMPDEEPTAKVLSDPGQAAFADRFGCEAERLAGLELGLLKPDGATEGFFALIETDADEAARLAAARGAVGAVAAE